jgi:hypothetical protein
VSYFLTGNVEIQLAVGAGIRAALAGGLEGMEVSKI